MIDELDLGFGEPERGRPRHVRGRGGKPKLRKKRRGRSFAAALLTLILLAVIGLAGWFGLGTVRSYFTAKDYSGSGSGEAQVQVVSGDSATEIGNRLFDAQVVASSKAFVNAAKANSKSRSIEAGYYQLHQHMKASLALDALLARGSDGMLVNKVSTKVTIPEGMITLDIYAALSKASHIPVQQFKDAAKDPVALGVPSWWFNRTDDKKGKKAPSALEGFLFPATYEFGPKDTAADMLSAMVKKFLQVTTDLNFADTVQKNLNISPYEALVAASIAQEEALNKDMPGVARVLYNRVYTNKYPCKCLQIDSETNYWLRISGQKAQESGNLTHSQVFDENDPYSTRTGHPGMPIGPISNPGKEALTAAMTPAPKNDNVYFLAIDKAGNSVFATTYSKFCSLVDQALANGVSVSRC